MPIIAASRVLGGGLRWRISAQEARSGDGSSWLGPANGWLAMYLVCIFVLRCYFSLITGVLARGETR